MPVRNKSLHICFDALTTQLSLSLIFPFSLCMTSDFFFFFSRVSDITAGLFVDRSNVLWMQSASFPLYLFIVIINSHLCILLLSKAEHSSYTFYQYCSIVQAIVLYTLLALIINCLCCALLVSRFG